MIDGGWLSLVDRDKDVIKSGGEWISSLLAPVAGQPVLGRVLAAVVATDWEAALISW